jgi:hypothetical protein
MPTPKPSFMYILSNSGKLIKKQSVSIMIDIICNEEDDENAEIEVCEQPQRPLHNAQFQG